MAGARSSLFSAEPLRRLLEANLGYRDLLDARVELHLVTTDLGSGQEVVLSSGDVASAVVASAAIPGVFPPVCRDGRMLIDGGIAEHTAIRHAIDHGADEVYLLPTGFPCALVAAPPSAVGVALQALTLLSQQQLIGEVARYNGPAKLNVLPPVCPLKVSAADFSRAEKLIARAKKDTGSWLDAGGPGSAHAATVPVNARRHLTRERCVARRRGIPQWRAGPRVAGDLDEQVRPVSRSVRSCRLLDGGGVVVGQQGGDLEGDPAVDAVGVLVDRGEQISSAAQVAQGLLEEHLLVGPSDPPARSQVAISAS